MSHRLPKTAAIVATAATAAFAAYAVGSQTNSSGTAGADQSAARGYGYGAGPGMPPGGPGPRDGRHGMRDRGAFLNGLAARLGVTPAALKAALLSLRPSAADRAAKQDAFAQSLADALKVDKARVTAALAKLRPDGPGDHRGPGPGARHGHGDIVAALATELGVPAADVRTALNKLRADHQAQEQKERDAFAQKLADKLGISVAKVKSVMAAGPFGHGGPGEHGPRHP